MYNQACRSRNLLFLFALFTGSAVSASSSRGSSSGITLSKSSSKLPRNDTVTIPQLSSKTILTTDGQTFTFLPSQIPGTASLTTITEPNGAIVVSSVSELIIVIPSPSGVQTSSGSEATSNTSSQSPTKSSSSSATFGASSKTSSSLSSSSTGKGTSSTNSAVTSSSATLPASTSSKTSRSSSSSSTSVPAGQQQPVISTQTTVISGTTQLIPVIIGGAFTTPVPITTTAAPSSIPATGVVAKASASAVSSRVNVDLLPLLLAWTVAPEAAEAAAAIAAVEGVLPVVETFLLSLGGDPTGRGSPCSGSSKRDVVNRDVLKRLPNLLDALGSIVHSVACIAGTLGEIEGAINSGLGPAVATVTGAIEALKSLTEDLTEEENDDDNNSTSAKSDSSKSSKSSSTSSASCTASQTQDIFVKCFPTRISGSQVTPTCTTSTSTVSGCSVTAFSTTSSATASQTNTVIGTITPGDLPLGAERPVNQQFVMSRLRQLDPDVGAPNSRTSSSQIVSTTSSKQSSSSSTPSTLITSTSSKFSTSSSSRISSSSAPVSCLSGSNSDICIIGTSLVSASNIPTTTGQPCPTNCLNLNGVCKCFGPGIVIPPTPLPTSTPTQISCPAGCAPAGGSCLCDGDGSPPPVQTIPADGGHGGGGFGPCDVPIIGLFCGGGGILRR